MSSWRNTRRTLKRNTTSELDAYENDVYVSESDSVGDGGARDRGRGDNIPVYEPKNNYITWVKLDSERSNINVEREYINEEQRFPKWVKMLDSPSFKGEYDRQRKLRRGLRSDFRGHNRTFLIEDDRKSRRRPVNYKPVRCRRCRARTVIFICLAFILILTCMVSVILTSLRPNAPSTPTPVYKFYEADCSITVDGVMTSGLADKSSEEYRTFTTDFCNAIQATQISEDSTYKDTYMGCLVYDIVNGSIVVKFRTLYGTGIPVQMADVQADIKKSSGRLGKFTADLSTLSVSVTEKQSTVDPTTADDIVLAPVILSSTSSNILEPTAAATSDSSSAPPSISDTPVSSNESPGSTNEAKVTDISMATHQTSAATDWMTANEAIDMQKSSLYLHLTVQSSDMAGTNSARYNSLALQSDTPLTMSYKGSINDPNPSLETSFGFQSTGIVINSKSFLDSANLGNSGSNMLLSVGSSYTGSSFGISSSAALFIGQSLSRNDVYNQSLVESSEDILQSISVGRSEILSSIGGQTLLHSSENSQPVTLSTEHISFVGNNINTYFSNSLLSEGMSSGITPSYSITSLTSSSSSPQVEISEVLSSDISNFSSSPSISSTIGGLDTTSSVSPSILPHSIGTLEVGLNSNTLSSIGDNYSATSISAESYIVLSSSEHTTSNPLNTMAVSSSYQSISFVGSSINVLPSYTLESHTISEINSSAVSTTYPLNNSTLATSSVNLSGVGNSTTLVFVHSEVLSVETTNDSVHTSDYLLATSGSSFLSSVDNSDNIVTYDTSTIASSFIWMSLYESSIGFSHSTNMSTLSETQISQDSSSFSMDMIQSIETESISSESLHTPVQPSLSDDISSTIS